MEPHDPTGGARPEASLRLRPLITVGTPLFGREDDLAVVTRLISNDGVRLLTLTGAGGTGKTRLACAAAVRLAADFGDGVCFVDLSAVEDAALVPAGVAQAIGVQESGSEPLEAILGEVLGDRAILLVLDNFEQVLGAVQFVAELLASCPRLGLLVTSREPLHLRAEQVLPVRPLPVPGTAASDPRVVANNPAVALFVDRGRACRPGFDLTHENVRPIAEICTRLDGLPLAIELAAAQLGVLSPKTILERLLARAPFVLSGVSDLPSRHRTLRAAVASSYDLLDAAEQNVFRWCGVFGGGFTAADAAAVYVDGQADLDMLPSLAILADKSLIQVTEDADGEPRFRWLETIRSFAVDHLTLSGELPIARRRHAEHYVAIAETAEAALVGRDMSRVLAALERDYDNFRAVFHWSLEGDTADLGLGLRLAGAMYRFWNLRGHLSEARQWLERALAHGDSQPTVVRAKALNASGVLAGMQSDDARAEACFAESLALWRLVGDTTRVAAAVGNLGQVAQNRRDVERAMSCFRESMQLYDSVGDRRGVAVSLGSVARLERQQGHDRQAVPLFERSVALFREVGDDRSLANSLGNLGHCVLRLGDLSQAQAYFTESLELRQALGNTVGIAECLEGFAALASANGRPRRAARLYGAAEALREITGAPLFDAERAEHDKSVKAVRQRLGERSLLGEWSAGRALALQDAVRFALRVAGDEPAESGEGGRTSERSILTRRELEVAALVARGLTNRQAAERLLVAPRTIETHLEHIFAKLGVQTRAELAAWAARDDLLGAASLTGRPRSS
ncbi:MAG TPA: tetratricopeptide repeat protein [Chloroflexota bacterium]|nr:tetratricopeptide repeat protein [Chloroflexota bacterium]